MNRTLHLHIGSYKTGTTSIQRTFERNRKELKRQGFCYPGREKNHHKLFFITRSPEEYWPREYKGVDKEILRSQIEQFVSGLEGEIKSRKNQYIISSEYFFFIEKEKNIREAVNYLESLFSEIKVYVFVRNTADLYKSYQQTKLRAQCYVDSPRYFRYNFKKIIENWSKYCDVEVIKYSKEIDSCRSFCERVGVNYKDLYQGNKQVNRSISIEQMVLLEKIQKNLYPDYNNILKGKIHLKVIPKVNAPFTTRPELQRWVAPVINENHQEDTEWLKTIHDIDLNGSHCNKKTSVRSNRLPINGRTRAAVREVYQVDEQKVEQYESYLINQLLKNLTGL